MMVSLQRCVSFLKSSWEQRQHVVGWKMVPKDIQILNLEPVRITLYEKRYVADVIKLRILW